MLPQVIDNLNCQSGKVYVDCTVGGAGHSSLIASKIAPDGRLICLDVDDDAIKESNNKLKDFNNVSIVKSNYLNLKNILHELNIDSVDGGILIDLGVSYNQITSHEKGFSFQYDSHLDMRMDKDIELTACDLVNKLSANELSKIFHEYGEERYSRRIASSIVNYRALNKLETTTQLANLVKSAIPYKNKTRIHPATRVFQALRIAVNNELEVLNNALSYIIDLMTPGSRIVIISFHSLEDRIVKNFFKYWEKECICDPNIPECRCNHIKKLKIINKKPIIPSIDEIENNPASRSAKLRVAERL